MVALTKFSCSIFPHPPQFLFSNLGFIYSPFSISLFWMKSIPTRAKWVCANTNFQFATPRRGWLMLVSASTSTSPPHRHFRTRFRTTPETGCQRMRDRCLLFLGVVDVLFPRKVCFHTYFSSSLPKRNTPNWPKNSFGLPAVVTKVDTDSLFAVFPSWKPSIGRMRHRRQGLPNCYY